MTGCWIDTTHASHPDIRNHTGGFMSLGTDAVMSGSNKQKRNSTSSTEGKLIACSNFTRKGAYFSELFLQAKGYKLCTTVFQDYECVIRLEKNGPAHAKFLNSYEEKERVGDGLSSHKSEIEKKDEAEKWNKDTKQVALAEIINSKHTEP